MRAGRARRSAASRPRSTRCTRPARSGPPAADETGFERAEGDGDVGGEDGGIRGSVVGVETARQIDRHDPRPRRQRQHPLDQCTGAAAQAPVGEATDAQDAVDHDRVVGEVGTRLGRRPHAGPGGGGRFEGGTVHAVADEDHVDAVGRGAQLGRRVERIAAVVARTGDDQDGPRSLAQLGGHDVGESRGGPAHQRASRGERGLLGGADGIGLVGGDAGRAGAISAFGRRHRPRRGPGRTGTRGRPARGFGLRHRRRPSAPRPRGSPAPSSRPRGRHPALRSRSAPPSRRGPRGTGSGWRRRTSP